MPTISYVITKRHGEFTIWSNTLANPDLFDHEVGTCLELPDARHIVKGLNNG